MVLCMLRGNQGVQEVSMSHLDAGCQILTKCSKRGLQVSGAVQPSSIEPLYATQL